MVLTMIQINKPPPLELEVEGVFVEEEEVHSAETMTNKGKGHTNHDKEEYIKLMKPLFDDITKNMTKYIMKVLEFMASQFGIKGVIGDSSSSQSKENKTMGGHIFSSTGPHNRPHEFYTTPRDTAPKFIIPK